MIRALLFGLCLLSGSVCVVNAMSGGLWEIVVFGAAGLWILFAGADLL